MHHPENDFSPMLIDQQIEHPATLLPQEEARLVRDLQSMYEQDNRAAINRVWMRLSKQQPRQDALPEREQGPESISSFKERGAHAVQRKQEPRQASAFVQRLSRVAALLTVALLVGSLALILTLHHAGKVPGIGHAGTATGTVHISPTPGAGTPPTSPPGWGKIVHTQTAPGSGFEGVAWSPDSKRIAALNEVAPNVSFNGGTPTVSYTDYVRIWDATTGQHLITVPFNNYIATLAWSPNSQQIAIGTLQNIIIVDSQSGHILRTLPASSQSQPSAFVSSGTAPLSSHIPASGGGGLRGLAWSPDGSQIAASFVRSLGSSSVLVWNLQMGTQVSLPLKSGYNVWAALGWSSNGEYIAADIALAAQADPLSASAVVVWKVATQQVVFQQNTGLPSQPHVNVALAWQPGTQNLAQIGVVKVGNGYATAIFILDGTTGKTLKQLVVPISGLPSDVLVWSPDGKYLAYTSPTNGGNGNIAQILDASTWKVVYTYKDAQNFINALAWSPDGHYIATNETVAQANVVKVWTALA